MKLTRSPRVASPLAIWLVFGFVAACSSTDEPAPLPGAAGTGGSAAGTGGTSGAGGSSAGVGGGLAGAGNAGAAPTGGSSSAGTGGGGAAAGGGAGGSGGSGGTSAGAAGAAGSAGAGGSNGNFGAELKAVAAIIETRCASMCHGQQEGLEGLTDLRTADLNSFYAHLTSPLMTDICSGKTPVVPGKPADSLLLSAIKGGSNDCGLPKMPAGCQGDACVPAADIQKIESWIAAGAPKN